MLRCCNTRSQPVSFLPLQVGPSKVQMVYHSSELMAPVESRRLMCLESHGYNNKADSPLVQHMDGADDQEDGCNLHTSKSLDNVGVSPHLFESRAH